MNTSETLKFGRYVFDPQQQTLLDGADIVPLSPKTVKTLEILLAARGRVIAKDEFMRRMWPNTFVEESNLTQNIFVLRKTLGHTDSGRPYVETIPKRGYRLAIPIEVRPSLPTAESKQPTSPEFKIATVDDERAYLTNQPLEAPRIAEHQDAPKIHDEALLHSKRRGLVASLFAALALSAVIICWDYFHNEHLTITRMERVTNDGVAKGLGLFQAPLVTDGNYLYFTEMLDNKSLLARASIQGAEVRSMPAPLSDAAIVDYSPQNGKLLIGSSWKTTDDQPILSRSLQDSRAQPVGEIKGHDASWSPDGQRLAFSRGRFLYLASADGTNVRRIVSALGIVFWPRWSPNGKMLRFSESMGSNVTELWEVNTDGSGLHQMFAHRADRQQMCCGSWSGDGRYYVYLEGGPASSSIWAVQTERSWWNWKDPEPQRLTMGPFDMWRSPLPDASGENVWAIGAELRGQLTEINPSTRHSEPYLAGISVEGLSFSPDAKWVAYTSFPKGTLWISRPDGGAKRQITFAPQVARFPRWSPDGKTIAYLGSKAGSTWHLYLADVASGQSRLLLQEDASEGAASWSPDGQTIFFGRMVDYASEKNPNLTIEMFDVNRHTLQTIPRSEGLWTPRLSPDGKYLTAVTEDSQTLRLYDFRSRQWTDLANVGVNDTVWSPDSQYVFFDTNFGGDPILFRVRVGDSRLESWADLRGLHRGGFFGPWVGMSPEGAPLVLRDTSIEEVYRLSLKASR